MTTTFNERRYNQLQKLRQDDALMIYEHEELMDMAAQKLFDMIKSDPSLMAVFKRLKDR